VDFKSKYFITQSIPDC